MNIKIVQLEKLIEKAKQKEDGVYSYQTIIYCVQRYTLKAYAKGGNIYQVVGMFTVNIGTYDYPDDARKALKRFLKTFK